MTMRRLDNLERLDPRHLLRTIEQRGLSGMVTLTHELLGKWQSMAVPEQRYTSIVRREYRNDSSTMQIVSGPYGREKVHYEAPPAARVPGEMAMLLDWYSQSCPLNGDQKIPGIARAGIAHIWNQI
jgi:Fic family protein